MHATSRGLDERISSGVDLCNHAFSERIYELGGMPAESLTRLPAPVSYGGTVDIRDGDVVRRGGWYFLDVGRLTQVLLNCYQRAGGMPDE
jgi:hypothetical protein